MIKLCFDSMYNARDFCCVLSNSSRVKPHLLMRSDNTAYATVKDIEMLRDYGIKSIVDIRSDKERMEEPDILEQTTGFNYFFFHFDSNDFAYFLSRNPNKLTLSLFEGYVSLLNETETIRKIIEQISCSLSKGGVLFHCSGGKDRTGLISMLIQMVLGIDHDIILEDYHETYQNLCQSQVIQNWIEKYGMEYVYCSPSLMSQTMNYLIQEYNSVEEYLHHCGIKKDTVESLRRILIQE